MSRQSKAIDSAPFDNSSNDADAILQSVDDTDFYVHEKISNIASPLFNGVFALPQATASIADDAKDGDNRSPTLPAVPVSEDAQTLDELPCSCYSVEDPERTPVQQLTPLPKVPNKHRFRVQDAILKTALKTAMKYSCVSSPLDGYAKAWRHRRALKEFVKLAADTYCVPLFPSSKRFFPIDTYASHMDDINADAYYRLLDYRNGLHARNQKVFFMLLRSRLWYDDSHLATHTQTHPFEQGIRSDAIIQSADDVDFYILRSVISYASPVLEKMLRDSQLDPTSTEPRSNLDLNAQGPRLPVLELPEDGRTLALLLQLCYPMPDPAVDTKGLHGVRELYEAATKYDVPRAAAFAKQACRAALDTCPLRVYFIAARFGWVDLMGEAAWRTVYDLSDYYDLEMSAAPASVYRRLLVYRQKCRSIIKARYISEFDDEETAGSGPGRLREKSLYWCTHEPWLSNSGEMNYWRSVHEKVWEGEWLSLMEADTVFPKSLVGNSVMDIARALAEVTL